MLYRNILLRIINHYLLWDNDNWKSSNVRIPYKCFILNLKITLFLQINVYSSMIKTKMMQAVTMYISWYVAW